MKLQKRQRRGLTSVLAMLYLVLFATLAIGFYAATNTQTQIASNDEHTARASLAAESGMDFMRYQLGCVSVPPLTPSDQVLDELYADLQAQLNDTGNLGDQTISRNGNTISIPASEGTIKLDGNNDSRFRATITDWAGEIVCKVDGLNGIAVSTRAISMDFTRASKPSSVFDFAVASKGQIVKKKNGSVTTVAGVDPKIATMMSAMTGNPTISVTAGTIGGDLNVIDTGAVSVTGGSVGGSSIVSVIMADHVHTVDAPEFPTIDTTVYKQYATNTYAAGVPLVNLRIPPNTNKKFTGNQTIQGIVYIESPNQIEFQGNVNLQGFIVFEPGAGTADSLKMTGNLTMSPVPNQPQFDALRAVTGVAVLAPNVNMTMTGSAGGNVKGNIIVNRFTWSGASELQIDQGTIMTYATDSNTCVFDSSKSVKFSATGGSNVPTAGIIYSSNFQPNPISYQEVMP